MTFAVIGLGAFGSEVAKELTRIGNQVIGIDIDEKRVASLASILPKTVIIDTTDDGALREAGIDRYDAALVAIGDDIEASILTTMNLKLLGISPLWVKASSRTHHRILSKLGADRVILPEQEMGRHIAQMLNNPLVADYVSLGNGFSVVNIAVPERLDDTPLADLGIEDKFDLKLLGVMRGTEFHRHDASGLRLVKGDKLIVLGKRDELRRFGDRI